MNLTTSWHYFLWQSLLDFKTTTCLNLTITKGRAEDDDNDEENQQNKNSLNYKHLKEGHV